MTKATSPVPITFSGSVTKKNVPQATPTIQPKAKGKKMGLNKYCRNAIALIRSMLAKMAASTGIKILIGRNIDRIPMMINPPPTPTREPIRVAKKLPTNSSK